METTVTQPENAQAARRADVRLTGSRRDAWQRRCCRAALLAACLGTIRLGAGTPQSHELARTQQAPLIDGRLDDNCWRAATVLEHFVKLGGQEMSDAERVATRAMLTADGTHLYIAVHCEEPLIDKLTMRYTERDSEVWRDDDVEIMIVPCEPGEDRYVQLAVNPAGAFMDAFLPARGAPLVLDYDSAATVKTAVGADAWTVEMRLPLANLPIESVSGPWSFHIARARRTTGVYLTSLTTPVSGFHDLEAYARLTGIAELGLPIGLNHFSFGKLSYGENVCTFEVTGAKQELTAMAIEVGGKPRMLFDQAALQIMTGTMALPYTLMPADRGRTLAVKAYCQKRLVQARLMTLSALPEKMLGRSQRSVFMFYPGNVVELALPLHITPSRDAPLTLTWTAADQTGKQVGSGLTTPAGDAARIRLYWRPWRPGPYTLDCRLARGGSELARQTQHIRLEANPWEVSQ